LSWSSKCAHFSPSLIQEGTHAEQLSYADTSLQATPAHHMHCMHTSAVLTTNPQRTLIHSHPTAHLQRHTARPRKRHRLLCGASQLASCVHVLQEQSVPQQHEDGDELDLPPIYILRHRHVKAALESAAQAPTRALSADGGGGGDGGGAEGGRGMTLWIHCS
jgi:hypothetical protein